MFYLTLTELQLCQDRDTNKISVAVTFVATEKKIGLESKHTQLLV
jgi:hypothetical protein